MFSAQRVEGKVGDFLAMDRTYQDIIDATEQFTGEEFYETPDLYRWIPLADEDAAVQVHPPDSIFLRKDADDREAALAHGVAYALQFQTVHNGRNTGIRKYLPSGRDTYIPFVHKYGFADWCVKHVTDADWEEPGMEASNFAYTGSLFYEAHEQVFGVDETVAMAFNPEPRSNADYIRGVLDSADIEPENERRIDQVLDHY